MADALALPRRMDTASVSVLAAQLREASNNDSVLLDARETMHIGALGAQLLVSTQQTMQAKGGSFSIFGLSERARGQLAVMGLPELTTTETAS